MLSNLTVASFLALVSWCLPLPSLITPATISVDPSILTGLSLANVTSVNISVPSQAHLYAYSVPVGLPNSTSDDSLIFLEPRTDLDRIAVATSSTGEILSITPPLVNASYDLQFYGPKINCSEANASVAAIIDRVRDRSTYQGMATEVSNYFFAFIPDLSGSTADEIVNQSLNLQNGVQRPVNGSNALWMVFLRYMLNLNGELVPQPYHMQCQLHNASYNVSLSFSEGTQNISDVGTRLLNEVDYPVNASAPSDTVLHSYAAFMWALSQNIVGFMGFYNDTSSSSESPMLSVIRTNIQVTSLLGSSDLDAFFYENNAIYGTSNARPAGQRLADIDFAQNRTLDVLIEELSFNNTLSFLSSDLLSTPILRNITTANSVNIYAYHASYLLLSYGIAIAFALIANILGLCAYLGNDASHYNDFSSILISTQDLHLGDLLRGQILGKRPLDKAFEQTKLHLKCLNGVLRFIRVETPEIASQERQSIELNAPNE